MRIEWVVGGVLALVLFPLGYMAADNVLPYDWKGGEVVPDPAPDGAQVSVHWNMTVNRTCPGMVQRQVIDAHDIIHNYDPVLAASGFAVKPDFWVTFQLPINMPPGPARYRVHAEYYCNPLQYIWPLRVTTPEIMFTLGN